METDENPLVQTFDELLFKRRDKEIEQFDERLSETGRTAVDDIGRVYTVLVLLLVYGRTDMRRYEAFSLFNEAFGSLISAFRLCREGFSRDALTLIRIAVEAGVVGAHVALDQEGYDLYMKTTKPLYHTRLGIQFGRRHVDPRVPQFIDNLASAATHPSRKGFGPDNDEEGMVINLGRPKPKTAEQVDMGLLLISTGACFVLRSIEASFVDGESKSGFYKIGKDHSMSMIAKKLLDDRYGNWI